MALHFEFANIRACAMEASQHTAPLPVAAAKAENELEAASAVGKECPFPVLLSGTSGAFLSPIDHSHRLADVVERLPRDVARPLATLGDDVANELRVGQILLGAGANRRLLREH